jgi:hypothetical protein
VNALTSLAPRLARRIRPPRLSEALLKAIADHPVNGPMPVPVFNGRPGFVMPDGSPVPAAAGIPLAALLTAPTFTPAAVTATRPIPVPASAALPPSPAPFPVSRGRHVASAPARPDRRRPPEGGAAQAWAARADRDAMRHAMAGLRSLDWAALDAARKREGLTYAGARQPAADPLTAPDWPVSRPAGLAPDRFAAFAADMRHKGGLPVFRHVARRVGWSGLNEEYPAVTP